MKGNNEIKEQRMYESNEIRKKKRNSRRLEGETQRGK
jgi:hypothetical protein